MLRLPRQPLVTSVLLTAVMLFGVCQGTMAAWVAGAADDAHACCPEQLEQAEAPSRSPATLPKCCVLTSGNGAPISAVPAGTSAAPAPPAHGVSVRWTDAAARTKLIGRLCSHSRLPIPPLQRTSVLLI